MNFVTSHSTLDVSRNMDERYWFDHLVAKHFYPLIILKSVKYILYTLAFR